jgi:uncharacterized protein (TIGR00255 family)
MIISMTGFGRASKSLKKMTISVEMRSINSKFMEITPRLPIIFIDKEPELKELIAKSISRGKYTYQLQSKAPRVKSPGGSRVLLHISLLSQMKKQQG